jgi:DNA polymerase sigma
VVNNRLAVCNTFLLRAYAGIEPRFRQLGVLIKAWAASHAVNKAADGFLSSYGHVLLLLHYLQVGRGREGSLEAGVVLIGDCRVRRGRGVPAAALPACGLGGGGESWQVVWDAGAALFIDDGGVVEGEKGCFCFTICCD